MAKILVTGATGYIGGDALFALLDNNPWLEENVSCLVRNSDKGAKIVKRYPKINLVYGNLDDSQVLSDAVAKSDLVCHFAHADHTKSATIITQSLRARAATGLPAYLIHVSGTGILTVNDAQRRQVGEPSEKVYDDLDNIKEVISLPDDAAHRHVDKIVLAAADTVKTAIVGPPTIYGPGRGPDNQRSIQWPSMTRVGLQRGKGFQLGRGLHRWTFVHVHDLSSLFVSLITDALHGIDNNGHTTGQWNSSTGEGYYFASTAEYVWGEMAQKIAAEGYKQGFLKTKEIDSIGADEADKLLDGQGAMQWGYNSRASAHKAYKVYGWTPKSPKPEEELPEMVRIEAEALGLTITHAQVAAGT